VNVEACETWGVQKLGYERPIVCGTCGVRDLWCVRAVRVTAGVCEILV
jgi:hypothetical protein